MSGYTPIIRRWASEHSRSGVLDNPDGTGEVGLSPSEAGRRLAVRFTLRIAGDCLSAVRYQVFGCGFTIAACAAAAELAEGKTLAEAKAITASQIEDMIGGLPTERNYCGDLAVQALQAALASASADRQVVETSLPQLEEHGPRVNAADPVYRALMDSPPPAGVTDEDRHLFACLLAVACQDPHENSEALGLTTEELDGVLQHFFPAVSPAFLTAQSAVVASLPPEINHEVLKILLSHVPRDTDAKRVVSSEWLAKIIAARAAHPGHLWTAMGLFERPQLTASIRRHLPTLAAANNKGMRWKRYLFKQVCDLHGAILCKSPNCGVCSDYELCFPKE